jgi:O-methyltransferase involved in polyketide biosynthesis
METKQDFNDVSATAIMTLACHAVDAQQKKPILNDQVAVATIRWLKEGMSEVDSVLLKKVFNGRLDRKLWVHIALRAKRYDDYVHAFLKQYPDAVVVNIACGLDDRFSRVDNGEIDFYEVDLPDILTLKAKRFPPTDRYHQMAQSVFDYSWMDQIPEDRPLLLLAEGLFMYCQEEEVKGLLLELERRFSGCEFVFELFNRFWTRSWRKPILKLILRQKLRFDRDAQMTFGLKTGREIANWSPNFKLLDDWNYFDSKDPRIGWMRLVGKLPLLRKTLWTMHWQLGEKKSVQETSKNKGL